MRLKIAQVGEAVLRGAARALTRDEIVGEEIQRLIGDMRETMHDAPGVGLAAPQIGVPLQLAVIEDREEYLKAVPAGELAEKERVPTPFHVIVNPQIEIVGDDTVEFFEGCLSLAGFSALVRRARRVRVNYLNEFGQEKSVDATGWYARILQHEIDHLRGTIYIDKMRSRSFTSVENLNRFWKTKSAADILRNLEQ